jgi:serine/threonine protein kinase
VDLEEALQYYETGSRRVVSNSTRCLRAIGKNICFLRTLPAFIQSTLLDLSGFSRGSHHLKTPVSPHLIDQQERCIDKPIGFGGNATVRLKIDQITRQEVAVKQIRAECYDAAQFQLEIVALDRLQHPCVLRLHSWNFPVGSQEAEIRTEYAEHGSLKHVLEQLQHTASVRFWNPTGKAIIICGIVLGMRFVHSKGYIHGDLKPANILIKAGGTALISDFGTSRLESDVTSTQDCGTVRYAAPELCEEETVWTRKADLFSFGLILYEILTGSPVFPPSLHPLPVVKQLRANTFPRVPDSCGELMQNLIRRCWLKDPASRPSFDDILNQFREADFELFPEVDRVKVRNYVDQVVREEQRQLGR